MNSHFSPLTIQLNTRSEMNLLHSDASAHGSHMTNKDTAMYQKTQKIRPNPLFYHYLSGKDMKDEREKWRTNEIRKRMRKFSYEEGGRGGGKK